MTLISIPIGVFYYISTLRNQNKARQFQIINSASKDYKWDFLDWEFTDYDDLMKKHGPESDPDGWREMMSWFNVLENWGVYVKEGLLDVRLVCLTSGGTIKQFFERYRGFVDERRIRFNRPRDFIEGEYLYERVVEYMEKHPEFSI